jgi:hypothetical protein
MPPGEHAQRGAKINPVHADDGMRDVVAAQPFQVPGRVSREHSTRMSRQNGCSRSHTNRVSLPRLSTTASSGRWSGAAGDGGA